LLSIKKLQLNGKETPKFMTANEIRKKFLEFFESKQHKIVPSAPMVIKNDPTLMFTNAGMNQFKDLFLGNKPIIDSRIADTQKCLRVSGKHNDLEEVGRDTYHHTMFEMLGNWSFGDYFKEDAINWAWELLINQYKIPANRLYATYFEGNVEENIARDDEAAHIWSLHLPTSQIIPGSKKDNFWEMGDTGPCGPCSEVHIDLRSDAVRSQIDGATLVNTGDPLVIEIWNLVFIQFNRKQDNTLEPLPNKHVDTGMGFERLCRVIQQKESNYDTDVFLPVIQAIAQIADIQYGAKEESDIAMRVIADHLRAITFSITDGQLPSNNRAGYVIRRILRRAVRYGYSFLQLHEPFMAKLIPVLIQSMGEAYPEIAKQKQLIEKVITEEEHSFLRTLSAGIKRLDQIVERMQKSGNTTITGKDVFDLHDSYGFPFDLTQLIAKEHNFDVDKVGFDVEMAKQKENSQSAAATESSDWIVLRDIESAEFVGYDSTEYTIQIARYRKVTAKGKDSYQLVFDYTPFYAESGGQIGDKGFIEADGERTFIVDTKKENELILHITEKLPTNLNAGFVASVNTDARQLTACHHSATHLLHHALRKVLGTHVEQKGSLVQPDKLRFDFSHFQKLSDDEITEIEKLVNQSIRNNQALNEQRMVPMKEAIDMGAMALFGEKYGDAVRVIQFGDSVELCGGTHVRATGEIGYFKIISESAIAAGIRRIEAIVSEKAEQYVNDNLKKLNEIKEVLRNPKELSQAISSLLDENANLKKQLEAVANEKLLAIKHELKGKVRQISAINVIAEIVQLESSEALRNLVYQLKGEIDNLVCIIGAKISGKANIAILISDNLVTERNFDAKKMIGEISREINGGGGGQAFYATAGGKNPDGIANAIQKALAMIS